MPNPLLITSFRWAFRALDTLRRDTDDLRLGVGITLGFALGLTPLFTLHELVFLTLLLVVRVNPLVTLASALFFAALFAPCDGIFHQIGYAVLTPPSMHRAWAGFYHWPILPHTHFYNTVVMGRWLFTVLASPLVYLTSRRMLSRHRPRLERILLSSMIWRTFATSRLYRFYATYHQQKN